MSLPNGRLIISEDFCNSMKHVPVPTFSRGWDPASEDDTHDNGMGRWSENNDEKGWW